MIDLNVDIGEGGSNDATLITLATSVNIACGGHAGDFSTMRETVALAQEKKIGAHPGYEDRANFGRVPLNLSSQKISDSLSWQIEALASLTPLHHVKPHGALYNQAQNDLVIAEAIVAGMTKVLPRTSIYTLPQGELAQVAQSVGHKVIGEGFIDRGYQENGQLVPRGEHEDLLTDPEKAIAQAVHLASLEEIETLCVHGDTPTAISLLRAVKIALQ
jgi:UPF0271 protein